MRRATWKVLSWELPDGKVADGEIELACPLCGQDAVVPTHGAAGSPIIAAIGLALIFDDPGHVPPAEFLPGSIQCRQCRNVFAGQREGEHV